MADTSDKSKDIDDNDKHPRNNPDEIQNPKSSSDTNDAENVNDVNTAGPITSTPHGKSEKTTDTNISSHSNNQGDTTALNTSSNRDESQEETGGSVEPNSAAIKISKVEDNDAVSNTSDQKGLEETKEANTSPNDTEDPRMDDLTSSYNQNEHQRRDNENTSSKGINLKRKTDSNIIFDADESDRSNDTSISYIHGERDLLESVFTNTTNENLIDRLLGCAYGQALGDAYGLSTEFEDRHHVTHNYPDSSKIIPFPDYILTGHSRRWSRGDWTDDTDQWILILETLIHHNGDEKVFAKKLTEWIRYGFSELGDHGGMGLGANVSQVVRSNNYIYNPLKASENVWECGNRQAAPNGAVMRCSASAFVHFNDPEKVKSTAILMCKTTHFDPRCIASCLAVCLTITYLLREKVNENDIESLIERVQKETIEIVGDSFSGEHRQLFLWHTDKARTLEELNLDEYNRIGYTYKCLASGFYGLRSTRPFKETLNDLIRYGGDADTNGAVCGTMYGARYGYKALPYEWLKEMPNKKWLDRKIIKCFEKMNLIENKAMETN